MKDLNVFIGNNASGKSTILDALRFLHEGVKARDFKEAVSARGGIIHLAWKGEEAQQIELSVQIADGDRNFEWNVRLVRQDYDFRVHEQVFQLPPKSPPVQLLSVDSGAGWWWSGQEEKVQVKLAPTACGLAAASADATFPARQLADFIGGWGFFDPNPFSLRHGWSDIESTRLDSYGRNLAERLYSLEKTSPEAFKQIVTATQSILGVPTEIQIRETEGRYYFAQKEPGLLHWVHQIGTSSGTLRTLALMTALFEETDGSLVGIEEPENHVHPTALAAFAEYLLKARNRVQILVTTHSPLLLDYLNVPEAICVVKRDDVKGTIVIRDTDSTAIVSALKASGFGLGEFYETKGFGG